ncbi:hypothetical protein BN874_1430005 [Candidatus Contendobacter odensis Run_B_J11]|uniref:Uncharacterized protein n=1 Tax=Candidatus Contendobacter odensis Run_B_J11 TaxID=1400861 RepID=A0A7U7GA87_9GAMM|nr:hypothetical protein BN874_1430005 [Candidatus Contendobacter odensis Run_B_J11]
MVLFRLRYRMSEPLAFCLATYRFSTSTVGAGFSPRTSSPEGRSYPRIFVNYTFQF